MNNIKQDIIDSRNEVITTEVKKIPEEKDDITNNLNRSTENNYKISYNQIQTMLTTNQDQVNYNTHTHNNIKMQIDSNEIQDNNLNITTHHQQSLLNTITQSNYDRLYTLNEIQNELRKQHILHMDYLSKREALRKERELRLLESSRERETYILDCCLVFHYYLFAFLCYCEYEYCN